MMNSAHEPDEARLVAWAEALVGARARTVTRCGNGGNNRVYRVTTERGDFALKYYPETASDHRDRLGHEFDGLRFLIERGGAGGLVPQPLAADRGAKCALYEWLSGTTPGEHRDGDVEQVVALLALCHAAARHPAAVELPPASEACLSARTLLLQIEHRLHRLTPVTTSEPELRRLLEGRFFPLFTAATDRLSRCYATRRLNIESEITPAQRTLSPSDFGFHNAVRRDDGRLAFLDFEYFGWDDPVKATADFLWHAGMTLSVSEAAIYRRNTLALYGDDDAYPIRLAAQTPLYGLRWVLIILNEFLPDHWRRRVFAGHPDAWDDARHRQLAKAETWLDRIADSLA